MSGGNRLPGAMMLAEMHEQPQVLTRLIERRDEILRTVAAVVPDPLRGIVLVARGSSDNAAVHGRYVLETAARVPVALAAPSLQTRYGVIPDLRGFLVVGVSQSGATPEIVTTVERLAAGGAKTLAVTNDGGAPLVAAADAALLLDAGTEQAVPATKTFTAQVAAMCLIAEALGPLPDLPDPLIGWEQAIAAIVAILADPLDPIPALQSSSHVLPVARGLLYAGALEVGLKLAETTGVAVHGTSPADLHHGPIATVHANTWALCFATPGPVTRDIADVAEELARRGAEVAAITEDPGLVPAAETVLTVPPGVAESLAVLPHVVRGQQLAHAAALAAGVNPDAPFALQKVTPTT